MQVSELIHNEIINDTHFFFEKYFPICGLINQWDNMYFHKE